MVGSGTVGSIMDADYVSIMTTLATFTNDQPRQCFNVSIVNDVIPEDDEVFNASLTLSPADQATFGELVTVAPDLASVTILDDEGKSL